MNRHRFWIGSATALLAAILLTSCMAPPPRPPGTQAAPTVSRPLAFGQQPNTVYDARADTLAPDANAAGLTPATIKVGLLLPLSGRNADLGKALQDAASVSLFDKYARLSINRQAVKVELLPKDTGDTPQQAERAMGEALAEGAQFIIGPVFAESATAATAQAQAKNISVLSFSNTRTQASPGTYMFGFSPTEQTERIINYAIQNGKTRIAVLAPKSPLGETVLTAARETVKKQGLRLAVESTYAAQGGMEEALSTVAVAGKPPLFDAILIPEGGPALDTILRGLNTRGVTPHTVQFLGTGLWDDADLLRRVNLNTAWFASSPPQLTHQFETRFNTTYNYIPPRIASLAYDAVALAVTLATSGRPFDMVTLTNPSGFSGPANGIFRLRANGSVQRLLAVIRVDGASLTVISPAPAGF